MQSLKLFNHFLAVKSGKEKWKGKKGKKLSDVSKPPQPSTEFLTHKAKDGTIKKVLISTHCLST